MSLRPGIVAGWHFDEGSGATAADFVTGDYPGSLLNTPSWVVGKVGPYALSFGGSKTVQVSDGPALRIASKITLAAWVYPTGSSASGIPILQKRSLTDYAAGYNYGLWLNSNGSINFEFNDGSYRANLSAVGAYGLNAWQRIVAVSDETVQKVRFYVNGQFVSEATNVHAMPSTGTAPVQIGCYLPNSGGPYPFLGTIDEPYICNVAWTADDVAADFRGGPSPAVLAAIAQRRRNQ